ncbi:unnamed protein product [Leptosia nina]|uniref:Uncharacterized protein n=1 Tax=Leptosia nina TaxID=320188 RepID=A0AAV1IY16_9NEOP
MWGNAFFTHDSRGLRRRGRYSFPRREVGQPLFRSFVFALKNGFLRRREPVGPAPPRAPLCDTLFKGDEHRIVDAACDRDFLRNRERRHNRAARCSRNKGLILNIAPFPGHAESTHCLGDCLPYGVIKIIIGNIRATSGGKLPVGVEELRLVPPRSAPDRGRDTDADAMRRERQQYCNYPLVDVIP